MNFCRLPESLVVSGTGWETPELPWAILDEMPGMSDADFAGAVRSGLSIWAGVCGLRPYQVDKANQARLLISVGRIDGPQGILAQCELPRRGTRQVRMTIDVNEAWVAEWSFNQRRIVLPLVVCHEGGHGCGCGHAPQGSPNIMAPVYSEANRTPGEWDLREMLARYPQSAIPIPPQPNPPMPPIVPVPAPPPPIPRSPSVNWLDTVERVLRVAQGVALLTETKADDQIIAGLLDLIRMVRSGAVAPSTVVAALEEAKRKVSGA